MVNVVEYNLVFNQDELVALKSCMWRAMQYYKERVVACDNLQKTEDGKCPVPDARKHFLERARNCGKLLKVIEREASRGWRVVEEVSEPEEVFLR